MSQDIISQAAGSIAERSPDAAGRENSSGGDSRSRRWMLTLRARLSASDAPEVDGVRRWTAEELTEVLGEFEGWCGQIEQGEETGYLHWQLYLEHGQPVRFESLRRKLPGAHLEQARKERLACVRYVTKEDTRVVGPFWHGDLRLEDFAGKRNDLEHLRNLILIDGMSAEDVLYTHPHAWRYSKHLHELEAIHLKRTVGRKFRTVVGEYYWGKTGTHKTRGVFELYGYENVYRVIEYGTGCFDQYAGEPVLMLDEYRSQFPISKLLAILEGHPFQVSARYANKWAQWERVIVVGNDPLRDQYRAQDGGSIIKHETRAALDRRFSVVRHYTGVGEYTEEMRP